MDPQGRITELEQALANLLGAVKKRSAWDYSDVLDEVFDAEYVLSKRGKRRERLQGKPLIEVLKDYD